MVAAGERARATKECVRRACAISRLRASARSGEGLGSDGAAVGRALCLTGNAEADVEYRSDAWRAWLGVGLGLGFGLALTLTLTLTLALALALTLITRLLGGERRGRRGGRGGRGGAAAGRRGGRARGRAVGGLDARCGLGAHALGECLVRVGARVRARVRA